MNLPSGSSLLRCRLFTVSNFGSSSAPAAVDRPLARDAWTNLPNIPRSEIKGVLAGHWGDIENASGDLNERRGENFGTPDSSAGGAFLAGRPAKIHFGDGHLLSFPLQLLDGQVAAVFPLDTLAYLQAYSGIQCLKSTYQEDEDWAWHGAVSPANLPASLSRLRRRKIEYDVGLVRVLAALPASCPVIVAARVAANALLAKAVEVRSMTALECGVARGGSLRVAELAPPGCRFIVLTTNESDASFPLPGTHPLQMGRWEGAGCGFLELTLVDGSTSVRDSEVSADSSSSRADTRRTTAEVMALALRTVQQCAEDGARQELRSVTREFGSRWRLQGLPSAVAFALARAKLYAPESSLKQEAIAYRHLLRSLVPAFRPPDYAACEPLLTGASPPCDLEEVWLWLRRLVDAPDEPELEKEMSPSSLSEEKET